MAKFLASGNGCDAEAWRSVAESCMQLGTDSSVAPGALAMILTGLI
ncbi:hypothetical protein [Bosea vaviloviae]|nr:hypothetical protein [Bosea vaviloviae]